MQKIVPSLWFEDKCEEAVNFYVDTFNGAPNKKADSQIVTLQRYPEGGEGPMKGFDGKVLTVIFELAGHRFMALDGGPVFKFNGAISLYVECEDQAEVDYFWDKFSAVPEAEQCGWLQDKYGISWQIVPKLLGELMSDPDPAKVKRVTDAFMQMKKFDIQKLQDAADGK